MVVTFFLLMNADTLYFVVQIQLTHKTRFHILRENECSYKFYSEGGRMFVFATVSHELRCFRG